MTAEYGGSCLSNLIPAEGGSGSFTLSLKDPFTGRTETTGALDFDTSAAEVQLKSGCKQFLRYLFTSVYTLAVISTHIGTRIIVRTQA